MIEIEQEGLEKDLGKKFGLWNLARSHDLRLLLSCNWLGLAHEPLLCLAFDAWSNLGAYIGMIRIQPRQFGVSQKLDLDQLALDWNLKRMSKEMETNTEKG